MEKEFSLIMATYGRLAEVDDFFQSLLAQDFDLSRVEVILVDQNDGIDLGPVVGRYRGRVDIVHIRSGQKGLSLNRNIGLKSARGGFVAFPDDDCRYYPGTLRSVSGFFSGNGSCAVLLGRIIDKASGANIIRNWKKRGMDVRLGNFFLNFSSITLFARRNDVLFDESFGVGAKYGSCEDADYLVRILKSGGRARYEPGVELWHPAPGPGALPEAKVRSYGTGFGAFCRKHGSLTFLYLFLKSTGMHLAMAVFFLLTLRVDKFKKRMVYVSSRLEGFRKYEA